MPNLSPSAVENLRISVNFFLYLAVIAYDILVSSQIEHQVCAFKRCTAITIFTLFTLVSLQINLHPGSVTERSYYPLHFSNSPYIQGTNLNASFNASSKLLASFPFEGLEESSLSSLRFRWRTAAGSRRMRSMQSTVSFLNSIR